MLDNIRQDLEGAIGSLTGANIPKAIYENVKPQATVKEFIRPTFQFAPTATDVGFQGSSRIDGTFIVQIFTGFGKGNGRAFQVADAVSNQLANKTFANGTTTTNASLRVVGIDQEARGFYQHNLIIPFRFFTGPTTTS